MQSRNSFLQKVVGSNPSVVYWMDIFSHWFVVEKLYCLFEKTENKRKKRPGLAHLKKQFPSGFRFLKNMLIKWKTIFCQLILPAVLSIIWQLYVCPYFLPCKDFAKFYRFGQFLVAKGDESCQRMKNFLAKFQKCFRFFLNLEANKLKFKSQQSKKLFVLIYWTQKYVNILVEKGRKLGSDCGTVESVVRFQYQRTRVHIQSLATFIQQLFPVNYFD